MLALGSLQGRFARLFKEEFAVEDGYSVVLGGLYRLSKAWALGAVIKPPYTLDGELAFPTILGTGLAWRPADAFTASLDVTWTDWTQYQYHENGKDTNPLTGDPAAESEAADTVTGRLGAEYLLIRPRCLIPLRCGLGYDPAPGVDRTDDFYTASVGAGVQLGKRWNVDIAYEFRWGNQVNGATLRGIEATQNLRQHRVLASVILYF